MKITRKVTFFIVAVALVLSLGVATKVLTQNQISQGSIDPPGGSPILGSLIQH